ncbi:MAG: sigma-70 family RNA polymerase sigma factor [Piscirickettsiaceae bacterium]|nr:sigma-70 family RNA polymerase sigma factor [Piscirickettsiaceae bacterium]
MKKNFKSKSHADESLLIKNLIDGDTFAFEHVVAEYHNLMLSVARAIVGDSIADEVVQEAWISAIKALPKFEGRSSLKTWLVQIVSNGAKSRVRRENRYSSLDDGWQAVPSDKFDHTGHRIDNVAQWETATPEALLSNTQLQKVIEQAFLSLPAMQRATMTMVDMEGYKVDEVCNILDISSSNARVLLHRARVTVHDAIERYQDN